VVTSFYHGEKNHYGFFTQVSNLILQSTIFYDNTILSYKHSKMLLSRAAKGGKARITTIFSGFSAGRILRPNKTISAFY